MKKKQNIERSFVLGQRRACQQKPLPIALPASSQVVRLTSLKSNPASYPRKMKAVTLDAPGAAIAVNLFVGLALRVLLY